MEDLREWKHASPPMPNNLQRDAVAALVDAMDLMEVTPDGNVEERICPEKTANPVMQRFYRFLFERAQDRNAGVPSGHDLEAVMDVPAPSLERLNSMAVGDTLKTAFNFTKVEAGAKGHKKKRFWREAVLAKKAEENGEVDVKRIKVGESDVPAEATGSSAAATGSSAPPKVLIGSVNPEKEFERWLDYRVGGVDVTREAIAQMSAVVERLAKEGPDFLGKALSCFETLRRGCVKEGEAETFNTFARNIRGSFVYGALWAKAKERGLGLVSDVEVPSSSISAEEARAFLAGEEGVGAGLAKEIPMDVRLTDGELEDLIE
eukprot:gnl/MRDRNA2_/MRDRNA2_172734_c0_seq1.p1 gnl/MRDRNA2_/MRDRNA2_172734_c0~~gnl/MRDRNA2_/MRDRNA2_172734_c0_seq1.p1  ORF type:complete len:339 (-),score=82.23 gnl/MRDRNA2_/MRDRNA2_172734_c0_seq1:16-972(-)